MAKYCSACNRETEHHYHVDKTIYSDTCHDTMDDFEESKAIAENLCWSCAKEVYEK